MELQTYLRPSVEIKPIIYAYNAVDGTGKPHNEGYIKVGFTSRHDFPTDEENAMKRIKEQTHTAGLVPKILAVWPAFDDNGKQFTDHDVHKVLAKNGCQQLMAVSDDNEWYKCELPDVERAVLELKSGRDYGVSRTNDFKMRPEQEEAVLKTQEYFEEQKKEDPNKAPKFLWNAKMRFGKTFATYELAKFMDMKRVLILTFKPAVKDSWEEDLNSHIDFDGWQFISEASGKKSINDQYEAADKSKPIVCFGSFQDFLGTKDGSIKPKNEWVHAENWDLVVFDEYHYGAWRDNARHLFETADEDKDNEVDADNTKDNLSASTAFDESYLPITTEHYLYLSGTPFRALNTGEFLEDQIFSWTYSDEQREKIEWDEKKGRNPYEMMPRIMMFTYQIDDITENTAYQGEFDEFDLNIFFKAEGSGLCTDEDAKDPAHFTHETDVQRWLDIMRGNFSSMTVASLKTDIRNAPLPYQDVVLRDRLRHTIWYLPNVAACEAMYNLLHKSQNKFYCNETETEKNYVICCAGKNVGNGSEALDAIRQYISSPFDTRTITLSCGKLTTGVTVKPWTGIFMLRNLKSPESYFQAAFRVQSPWTIKGDDGLPKVVKPECYIFDFAINRALRQVADYACKLETSDDAPERKIAEFTKYLPILAFDGTSMQEANAQDILDWTINGTTANLLARKWKDASLIHVDNDTLEKILSDERAQEAIGKIESWRNLRDDIEILIKKSKSIKDAKTKDKEMTKEEKKQVDADEKEVRNRRKEIQDKLLHFMSRLPVFMYMTDCREQTVNDVIKTYEPELFYLVTGLDTEDYQTFIELGVFDSIKMNSACGAFRRYEDSSMTYAGIDKHEGEEKGLFDISVSPESYKKLFGNANVTVDSGGVRRE